MVNPEHLEILKQGVEAWNQWRENNPDVEPDLSHTGVNETLNEAGKTTDEVKELVKALFPTVVKVAGWLGYAAGKIWMTLP